MRRAIIKRVKKGNRIGQWRFVLLAANSEPVGSSGNESYHNLKDMLDTLEEYFPNFPIVDSPDYKKGVTS